MWPARCGSQRAVLGIMILMSPIQGGTSPARCAGARLATCPWVDPPTEAWLGGGGWFAPIFYVRDICIHSTNELQYASTPMSVMNPRRRDHDLKGVNPPCNTPPGCITFHGTYNSSKPCTRGNRVKGFTQYISHYGWLTLDEWKVRLSLTFNSLV